jgi:pimeloyl-ACP methyl ester carboxylesterase
MMQHSSSPTVRAIFTRSLIMIFRVLAFVVVSLSFSFAVHARDIEASVQQGYADSAGVKIHYVTLGDKSKPAILFIHGFPDYWYTWRDMMDGLSGDYYTIAVDQRGYNLSDKPKGEQNYAMSFLVEDIAAVARQLGVQHMTVVGHDWGGAVAWEVAMRQPQLVERLVVLNLPHLRGIRRELASNEQQYKNSAYARFFLGPDAAKSLTTEKLVDAAVPDKTKTALRERYQQALGRSDIEAMLSYYRQNYPKEPYAVDASPVQKIQAPVLLIHGLRDPFLLPGALNNTWDWLDQDLTLYTLPDAGHWVQHDQPEKVLRMVKAWLAK